MDRRSLLRLAGASLPSLYLAGCATDTGASDPVAEALGMSGSRFSGDSARACAGESDAGPTGSLCAESASDLQAGDSDGRPLVVRPEEGVNTTGEMLIKVPSSSMSGHFSIMHGELDGLQLLPPHTHRHEDQAVYVLEGVLEFEFAGDGQVLRAPAGSYVIKPRGTQHAFWNPGDSTVSYVEFSTERGFEGYVRDVQGPESLPQLERTYGVAHDVQETIRLVREHGLTSIHRVPPEQFALLQSLPG